MNKFKNMVQVLKIENRTLESEKGSPKSRREDIGRKKSKIQ